MNTPWLLGEGEGFPDRPRMTGASGIGAESFAAHRDPPWFQICIMCRCLDMSEPGVDRDDLRLGLEVRLTCSTGRWESFDVYRNTEPSTI